MSRFFFFCRASATTEIYTLSLHDALPIFWICNGLAPQLMWFKRFRTSPFWLFVVAMFVNVGMWLERFVIIPASLHRDFLRSEEHTSELQSQSNLVCRLLLEKKKKKSHKHQNQNN